MSSSVEHSAPGRIGCVRPQLVALDDGERSLSYEMIDGPFPIRRYRATVRVFPVSEEQCFVEWYAHFDAEAADEAELDKTFADGVFATGLKALRTHFM